MVHSFDPRNASLEPEYYGDVDGQKYAERKPLIWFWMMFDRSPVGINHWLGFRVVGKNGRDSLGARVDVVTASGSVLRRRVRTDGSYLSANDPRVLVGLGVAKQVKSVRVRWPNGTIEEWKNVAVDRYTTLNEGAGSAPL